MVFPQPLEMAHYQEQYLRIFYFQPLLLGVTRSMEDVAIMGSGLSPMGSSKCSWQMKVFIRSLCHPIEIFPTTSMNPFLRLFRFMRLEIVFLLFHTLLYFS